MLKGTRAWFQRFPRTVYYSVYIKSAGTSNWARIVVCAAPAKLEFTVHLPSGPRAPKLGFTSKFTN